jgi:hypothetical protein
MLQYILGSFEISVVSAGIEDYLVLMIFHDLSNDDNCLSFKCDINFKQTKRHNLNYPHGVMEGDHCCSRVDLKYTIQPCR